MCWGKLPRHPGRAHASPFCARLPRPHLAAAKLVELRSSVKRVRMHAELLDRRVAPLADPGLRDIRCAHIAPPLGYHRAAALRLTRREPKGRRLGCSWGRLRRRLAAATGTGSARKARSARSGMIAPPTILQTVADSSIEGLLVSV
jgi:hypothetical protein